MSGSRYSAWWTSSFVLAWVFLFVDFCCLFTVIFRRSVAMRHDTISSYLGKQTLVGCDATNVVECDEKVAAPTVPAFSLFR